LELISEIVEQTTGEPLRSYSVEKWLQEWLAGKKSTKSRATSLKYEAAIGKFLESLGPRARLNLRHIAPRDVLHFRESEVAAGKQPGTCNDYLGIVRSAFTAARKQGLITHNPAEAVERFTKDSEPTRQPFTLEQIQALLRAAEGDWYGAIMVALYTGTRLHDVANLRWDSVDLDKQWISYKASKTRRRVTVPMHPALRAWLKKQIRGIGKALLFPTLADKSTSKLSREFSDVMERANVRGEIVRERENGTSGRSVRTLSFHSLRHAYASIMANRGVAEEVRMKLAGHSSQDVHAGYTHHEAAVLRAAIAQLPDVSR
jgi:integrase